MEQRRVTGGKIISYSLFGADASYRMGALANCALARQHFPGWTCRVYVAEAIAGEVTDELRAAGAEVAVMAQKGAYDGLYWRFLPAADPRIEAVVVRDADARLGPREKVAVDQWLESGEALHVMRDHPAHRRLIPAGLWGCRGGAIPDMAKLVAAFGAAQGFESRTGDADFLERHVYPRFRDNMFVHSAFTYFPGEAPRIIPLEREGNDYLGRPVGRDEALQKRVSGFERNKHRGQTLMPLPAWMSP